MADYGYMPLPCPFCGGEAEIKRHNESHVWVECVECAAKSNAIKASIEYPALPVAVEAWNKREHNKGVDHDDDK